MTPKVAAIETPPPAPPVAGLPVARLRAVHRAASELRRGAPVLLLGAAPLVLLAAETAGPQALAEIGALTHQAPLLLLAPARAAAVLHRPVEQAGSAVALRLPTALLAPETLRSLADPTEDQALPVPPKRLPFRRLRIRRCRW